MIWDFTPYVLGLAVGLLVTLYGAVSSMWRCRNNAPGYPFDYDSEWRAAVAYAKTKNWRYSAFFLVPAAVGAATQILWMVLYLSVTLL